MVRRGTARFGLVAVLPAAGLVVFSAPLAVFAQETAGSFHREDPAKIVSAEKCGECHVLEAEVWKRTTHNTGFKTMHRKESAETIARAMAFRLIKRDSLCISCHYTPTEVSGQPRALSGVSCESCHGAGRDWMDIHNDYGGRGLDHSSESAEHKATRVADSIQKGMRRPSRLYEVAKSCYGCHIVPEEDLVNVGGHGTGSGSFELVEWSQEKGIRHNFLAAQRGGSSENVERDPARKRVMYVVGRGVALETALRGVAAATGRGRYLKAMQGRVRGALGEVRAISGAVEMPEFDELARIIRGVRVNLDNQADLLEAADRIGALIQEVTVQYDGTELADLDPLLAGIYDADDSEDDFPGEDIEGTVTEVTEVGEAAEEPQIDTADPAPAASADAPTAQASAGTASAAQRAAPQPSVAGERKRRIRAPSSHKTLGDECGSCHGPQNTWWYEDAHSSSADPFWDRERKQVQIATFYNGNAKGLARGTSVCMDCHGTIVTGRESREVEAGVGCESCHGAAGDYIESHREGEKSLGVNRPGYVKALQAGMVELQDLGVRARTCTGCHYITDRRLISSGHPSGKDFDYAANMNQVKHWDHELAPSASLREAFSSALASRGGVPDVPIARAPSPGRAQVRSGDAPTAEARTLSLPPAGGPISVAEAQAWHAPSPRPARSSSVGTTPVGASGSQPPRARPPIELPDFPDIEVGSSIEDILQQVKERLERIHRLIYSQ